MPHAPNKDYDGFNTFFMMIQITTMLGGLHHMSQSACDGTTYLTTLAMHRELNMLMGNKTIALRLYK